jgi:hypothetical protein
MTSKHVELTEAEIEEQIKSINVAALRLLKEWQEHKAVALFQVARLETAVATIMGGLALLAHAPLKD